MLYDVFLLKQLPFEGRSYCICIKIFSCINFYLRQGGFVASLFVCLLATLHKNVGTDLHETFREGWQWANQQMIKFWWQSRSGIQIMTLVRRAFGGGMHPVLLVFIVIDYGRPM